MIWQAMKYGVVGLLQLGLEWLAFIALTALLVPVSISNVIARAAGASVGFWLNSRFTFPAHGIRSEGLSLYRYGVTWSAMTVLGTVAVMYLDQVGGLKAAWLGKPIVDVALAGVSFLASKYWIYRSDCPKG